MTKRKRCADMVLLPVFIVEDHNDVLPPIHRLIGSKRLGISNLTLVHFDAHSDLSTPREIDADTVFHTQLLYESLSIENWILPLVYGGHVCRVVWIKPPWVEDSMSRRSQFNVGRNVKTNRMCVSSTDNYFLSELSYAPTADLNNVKQLDLLIRTINYITEPDPSDQSEPDPVNQSDHCSLFDSSRSTASSADQAETSQSVSRYLSSDHLKLLGVELRDLIGCRGDRGRGHIGKGEDLIGCRDDRGRGYVGEGEEFILDIDLDFFSTADPFHSQLTGKQYGLLKQLYQFIPPSDLEMTVCNDDDDNERNKSHCREESVKQCVADREVQISELREAMRAVAQNKTFTFADNNKQLLFSQFVVETLRANLTTNHSISNTVDSSDRLQSDLSHAPVSPDGLLGPSNDPLSCDRLPGAGPAPLSDDRLSQPGHTPIDWDWLHEIGTGIDDSPLPHHRSSSQEIHGLLNSLETVLKTIARPPAVITISRSSDDGYCPASQVEEIQKSVIDMLRSVYSTNDLQFDLQYLYLETSDPP